MSRISQIARGIVHNWDTNLASIGGIAVGIGTMIWSTFNQTNIPLILSWTLITLGVLAISIRRDRKTEKRINKIFAQQHDAYRYLIEVINHYGAKEAVFIQYSGQTSLDVLRTVLSNGARATVFLQHEDIAAKLGSQLQSNRIRESSHGLHIHLGRNLPQAENLKIYKYTTPGSVSAIKIDNRVLCMGWYTYEKVNHSNHKHYSNDEVAISGHDVAALVVWRGTDEFEALDKTFSMLEINYRTYAEEVLL